MKPSVSTTPVPSRAVRAPTRASHEGLGTWLLRAGSTTTSARCSSSTMPAGRRERSTSTSSVVQIRIAARSHVKSAVSQASTASATRVTRRASCRRSSSSAAWRISRGCRSRAAGPAGAGRRRRPIRVPPPPSRALPAWRMAPGVAHGGAHASRVQAGILSESSAHRNRGKPVAWTWNSQSERESRRARIARPWRSLQPEEKCRKRHFCSALSVRRPARARAQHLLAHVLVAQHELGMPALQPAAGAPDARFTPWVG